jgi:hypothetical protein
MATYVNDLRLKEITTGDESGTWGTSTNTNLELIANAMGLGAEAIPNASTHTITMADGAADEFRSTFLRLTGGGQTCTVTLGPSTLSHTWIMRNETAAALTLTQGSGANVVIAAGQTKIVSTDGGGSGAIVYEMDDLELAGNLIASAATITTLASSAATLTGGTVNGMVVGGSTPAAGTFTTLTANTSATVSGDLTVDTSTLKVDSTNNRVGILNASPDVVLDIGSSTDAVHMPVGTTGQRPTGAAGYFRYNSTLSQFEGYTDGWGAIGGGGGSNLVSNTMTGDGSTTTISLTNNPQNENNTQVYIDGVYQNKDTYSVSGTTLTFSTAPPLGTAVEVMTIEPTAINIPADGSVTPAKIASGDFYFDTNTLYVDATNNRVGIGITPATLLDIKESTAATDAIIGLTAGTGGRAQIRSEAQADNTSSELSFYTMSGSNTSEAMRISGSNVGIGTTSPATQLFVKSASNAANVFAIESADAAQRLQFGVNTSNGGSYIFEQKVQALRFGTSDTERMRIDASGNVGIGVTPPAWGSAYANVNVGTAASFWGSKAGTSLAAMSDNSYFNGSAYIARNTGAGSKYYQNVGAHYWDRAASVSAGATQTNVTGMILDSSGRLLVNTTSILSGSGAKLQVLQDVTGQWSQRINNSAADPYGLAISYTSASPNSTYSQFHYCVDSTGARWGVYSNGGVLNYSGNNVNLSDRNAKKDITLHTDNEWDCVKAWEIVDYRYKDEADDSPAKIGVIAQQIQEHCPDLVNVFQEQADAVEEVLGEDGEVVTEAKAAVEKRIGVNEAQMMWKVTKALQEAMERIETLEAKVQTLENN